MTDGWQTGDDDEFTELRLESVDEIAARGESLAALAARQRAWRFGHVIVDEAQDLTPMQWRMIVRRARSNSMTIVGDLAQRSTGPAGGTWRDRLPPAIDQFAFRELTINYRSPAEVGELAAAILGELAPELAGSAAIRHAGVRPRAVEVGDLASGLAAAVAAERTQLGVGRIGVITMDPDSVSEQLGDTVDVLTPRQSKGLEFDAVIVVEPAEILDAEHGLSLLYVAVTRTTRLLTFVHRRALPVVVARALSA